MMAFKNSDYASLFQFTVHQLKKKRQKKAVQTSTGDYFQIPGTFPLMIKRIFNG